jgi:hypothetical protein
MIYGKYDIPFKLEQDGFSISMQKAGESYRYSRTCLETSVEKSLILSKGDLVVHPVEPLNTPKAMTSYLIIEFDTTLVLEPKATKKIFLTFPVEIAVMVSLNKNLKVIDSFSLAKQKFTLYGEPKNGWICKHWNSAVSETMIQTDPLREGVLELMVSNLDSEWNDVTKAVFNAYGMKIFYGKQQVMMKARMKIRDDGTAETGFQDSAPERGMKKSLETFATRKLSVTTTAFIMEYGI